MGVVTLKNRKCQSQRVRMADVGYVRQAKVDVTRKFVAFDEPKRL